MFLYDVACNRSTYGSCFLIQEIQQEHSYEHEGNLHNEPKT